MSPLGPLVSPADPLTSEEFTRYSRHVLLPEVGEIGQRRLKSARVLVVGAGGLGAPALQYLAAAGVGTIGIIDDDVVDETNLQRQVIHGTSDIGVHKVDSAVEAVRELNPLVEVMPHHGRLNTDNAQDLFSQYDLILDGTDNFPTRYLISDEAAAANVPVLWASVLGFDAQLSLFWAAPPSGQGVTLRDVFPHPPAPGLVPSCAQAGVVGAMVGHVGALMAGEAVKLIIGVGEPLLGRIMIFDQLRTSWTSIPVRPRSSHSAQPRPEPPARAPMRRLDISYVTSPVPGTTLIDVREDDEVDAGMIPGAVHIPLALALTELGRRDLDPNVPLVIYCAMGPRAEQAAAHLSEQGFTTHVLEGGYTAWIEHPTTAETTP